MLFLKLNAMKIDIINLNRINSKLLYWEEVFMYFLYRISLPYKVRKVRKKNRIRVLFVISELGAWKTEVLYLRMLGHHRFEPMLGITRSMNAPYDMDKVESYMMIKGYNYIKIGPFDNLDKVNPDIIFYQKPYDNIYYQGITYRNNLNRLFCLSNYYFSIAKEPGIWSSRFFKYAWQIYMENDIVKREISSICCSGGRNMISTGFVMSDVLLLPKDSFSNPWKPQKFPKKKVIYAPHHSISNFTTGSIDYSTFLEIADDMLSLVEKYKDTIQWAFKPHPVLYNNLLLIWGKERTDSYYGKWASMDNSQLAEGEYIGLFKYSDAMIHDCASFTVEYHYTLNPVMYIEKHSDHIDSLHEFGKKAYGLHYIGKNIKDVESFLNNVLNNVDYMFPQREHFYKDYLDTSNSCKVCDNIINAIIGS